MSRKYRPIKLALIEEGRLQDDLEEELARAAKSLALHVGNYGAEAKGATASVTLTITLKADNIDDELYQVEGKLKTVLPGRPVRRTMAIGGEDENGRPLLEVRASGSTKESPEQGRLTTDDGRPIDQETGEIDEDE